MHHVAQRLSTTTRPRRSLRRGGAAMREWGGGVVDDALDLAYLAHQGRHRPRERPQGEGRDSTHVQQDEGAPAPRPGRRNQKLAAPTEANDAKQTSERECGEDP